MNYGDGMGTKLVSSTAAIILALNSEVHLRGQEIGNQQQISRLDSNAPSTGIDKIMRQKVIDEICIKISNKVFFTADKDMLKRMANGSRIRPEVSDVPLGSLITNIAKGHAFDSQVVPNYYFDERTGRIEELEYTVTLRGYLPDSGNSYTTINRSYGITKDESLVYFGFEQDFQGDRRQVVDESLLGKIAVAAYSRADLRKNGSFYMIALGDNHIARVEIKDAVMVVEYYTGGLNSVMRISPIAKSYRLDEISGLAVPAASSSGNK